MHVEQENLNHSCVCVSDSRVYIENMPSLYVSCHVFASCACFLCIEMCIFHVLASCVSLTCMPNSCTHIYIPYKNVSRLCLICMPLVCASCICFTGIPHMYAHSVYLFIYVPHTNALLNIHHSHTAYELLHEYPA